MALISVTRLQLRTWRVLPGFLSMTLGSWRQAQQAPGNLGVRLVREAGLIFWTLTAWEDETAMRAYMTTGNHRQAMPKLMDWCDEAAVVHWTQPTAELPDMAEAHRRMQTEGHFSRVRNPSPDQAAGRLPDLRR